MFFWLIILFTTIPIIELLLLIELGKALGTLTTIIIVLGTGFVGAFLAKAQGFSILISIRNQLRRGILPAREMFNGLCILIGGVLLLTPGILTDIFGILLLCSPFQYLLWQVLKRRLVGKFRVYADDYTRDDYGRKQETFFVKVENTEEDEEK